MTLITGDSRAAVMFAPNGVHERHEPTQRGDPGVRQVVQQGMNAMKRSLAALVVLSGGALALTAGAAHADSNSTLQGAAPLAQRVGDVVGHPDHAVQDTKTALAVTGAVTGTAANSAANSANSSLAGSSLAGTGTALQGGLPHAPKAR